MRCAEACQRMQIRKPTLPLGPELQSANTSAKHTRAETGIPPTTYLRIIMPLPTAFLILLGWTDFKLRWSLIVPLAMLLCTLFLVIANSNNTLCYTYIGISKKEER